MTLLTELKRRNVIRMAGLYLVGAWLVTQVAATLLPVFDAPAWAMKAVVGVLAAGFIPAVAFAWAFELTPDGLKRDADVPPEQSIAPQTARRMERVFLLLLALALGFFAFDKFVLAPRREAALVADTTKAVKAEAGISKTAVSEKSIAVLPFDDLSPAKDQAYFSDGIAEELLNALAQVQGLKVAGRASSAYYKGRNLPLAELGKALAVATVLEGSVRKQGEQVRISARLTRVSDNRQLWADSYDGDLKDVFALQERIARNIAGRLQLLLNDRQQAQLVDTGTSNPEAYQLYLQASSIFNRRDRTRFLDAIAALQRAVKLDPNYARAYARLASLYVVLPSYTDADPRQASEQVMRHAAQALALDPDSAEAWAARGASLSKFRDTQLESRDAYEQAMRINPNDPNAVFWNGLSLLTTGYRRQGTAQIEHTLALDPMMPNALRWRGMLYLQDGDFTRAEPMLQRAYDLGLVNTANALSEIAMHHGDAEASARMWVDGNMGLDFNMTRDELAAVHRGIFGNAAAKQEAVQTLQGVLAKLGSKRAMPTLPLYLFRLDAPKLGLEILNTRQMGEGIDAMNWIWTRQGAPIRALPEFDAYLRAFHFPEIWDKYGPPDMCTKSAAGDYVCQ
ncbi:tetratricopeptide repeat protein [Thermomonas sp. HDW16]|uniref:tetratricopeptide repeat protein n=1 Tax=Thermomonas sp. HDW16 TaxID=2714945 RepID=UPI00140DC73B|nr:tetratricopeptide repeat protein [Thermomonas sp. HDW16]QIL20420.1 tetratricopeptide repeat protein [Thermomonas sp. HDW16]